MAAAKAATTASCVVGSGLRPDGVPAQRDGRWAKPLSVWVNIFPELGPDGLSHLMDAARTAGNSWLATQHPDSMIKGVGTKYARFDGRPDRVRMYLDTCSSEAATSSDDNACFNEELKPHPVVALSIDQDGTNPGEETMMTFDSTDLDLPLEPERIPS